jgi:TRAP-type mannitol/chloroaromatic compound transport system permease small subunit
MQKLAKGFTQINVFIGKSVSWLSVALIAIIVVDVTLRYLFSITSAASFELEWHLFAALFLLSAGWTFSQDRHVRVDVFYQRFSEKRQAWVNLLGTLLFLLPFCFAGFVESLPFVKSSYLLGETSPDPGGLPARWIIKSTIPMGFLLLGLQGIAEVIKSLNKITDATHES